MRSWSEVGKHVLQEYLLGDAFLWRLPSGADCALTFDDGPNVQHTPRVLDLLHVHGVQATRAGDESLVVGLDCRV